MTRIIFAVAIAFAVSALTPRALHADADPLASRGLQEKGFITRYGGDYVLTVRGFRVLRGKPIQEGIADGWRMFGMAIGIVCPRPFTNSEIVAALNDNGTLNLADSLPDAIGTYYAESGCHIPKPKPAPTPTPSVKPPTPGDADAT